MLVEFSESLIRQLRSHWTWSSATIWTCGNGDFPRSSEARLTPCSRHKEIHLHTAFTGFSDPLPPPRHPSLRSLLHPPCGWAPQTGHLQISALPRHPTPRRQRRDARRMQGGGGGGGGGGEDTPDWSVTACCGLVVLMVTTYEHGVHHLHHTFIYSVKRSFNFPQALFIRVGSSNVHNYSL
uniref:Uncharacterized protein n=1 Tax=Echinococcus granulosus TaxID=6210 RepID=U6FVK8_ECHGR|nr:hypothetical protein EgrG_002002000 [Echinococcus granulosus]